MSEPEGRREASRSGGPGGEPRGRDGRAGSGPRDRSRTAPGQRHRQADKARSTAYSVLRAVDDGAYANLELPAALRWARVSGRDAAFATELTYGTIRMQGLYDPIIALAADRPVDRLDPDILAVLRLGVHQMLGMRVAAHAAADQSVALAREQVGVGASGLVNAVLRRVGESDLATWRERVVTDESDPLTATALLASHPRWVVAALRQALRSQGVAAQDADAELDALLEAHNTPARVAVALRPGLADLPELAEFEADSAPLSPVGALLAAGDPGRIPAIREGRAAVQDEGSQLLALALAAVPVESESSGGQPSTWLDLCAGPGGKAGLLAALALQQGADLVANEVSEHRTDLVRGTLRAAAGRAATSGRRLEVRTGDGRLIGQDEPETYDRVLVDAPCTGLGALRRRPEARWRRTPADLGELGPLQRALLSSAIDATRPGGVIGYATCSPHQAETSFVVADVIGKRPDIEQLDARQALVEVARPGSLALESLGPGPAAQMWPHRHGTDGMFLALLRKRA